MTATIRRATPADWPQIHSLLTRAALPLDGAREAFALGFVADDGAQIVGSVALEIHESAALLRSLAVDGTRRGEGLGRRLVDAAVAEARRLGTSSVHLLTTTAASFFPRCGFAITTRDAVPIAVAQSIEFREACPASAVVMALQFRAEPTQSSK